MLKKNFFCLNFAKKKFEILNCLLYLRELFYLNKKIVLKGIFFSKLLLLKLSKNHIRLISFIGLLTQSLQ